MAFAFARQINELPSLPQVVLRLVQTLDDPSSSAMDVENILALDQSATARLLAVANSAYYGMHHAVNTVGRAVIVLGLEEVRGIAMGSALSTLLTNSGFSSTEAARRLWLHALAVQEASLLVARSAGLARADLAGTAGLLHDLGWVVIMKLEPEKWDVLENAVLGQDKTISEAEKLAMASHQQAGESLAAHWDMPPALAEVMAHHHSPRPESPHYALCQVVQLADYLACSLGLGPLKGKEAAAPAASAAKELGCRPDDILALRDSLKNCIERKWNLWGELGLKPAPESRID